MSGISPTKYRCEEGCCVVQTWKDGPHWRVKVNGRTYINALEAAKAMHRPYTTFYNRLESRLCLMVKRAPFVRKADSPPASTGAWGSPLAARFLALKW